MFASLKQSKRSSFLHSMLEPSLNSKSCLLLSMLLGDDIMLLSEFISVHFHDGPEVHLMNPKHGKDPLGKVNFWFRHDSSLVLLYNLLLVCKEDHSLSMRNVVSFLCLKGCLEHLLSYSSFVFLLELHLLYDVGVMPHLGKNIFGKTRLFDQFAFFLKPGSFICIVKKLALEVVYLLPCGLILTSDCV